MKTIYGIFGAGGYGREVAPLARAQLQKQGKSIDDLFFVVDVPEKNEVNGIEVVSEADFLKINAEQRYMTYAIADSAVRSAIRNRARSTEVLDWTVAAENCVIMDKAEIGRGSILSPFVTITSNVTIGVCFHANLYSYVAHDCVIGDFVTFAPGVKCNGNVSIGNHAYVGTGAIIRPGEPGKPLLIGEGAIIGMGSVVTKDVPPGVTIFGNPARTIKD